MNKGFIYGGGGGDGGAGLAQAICTIVGGFAGACTAIMSSIPLLMNSPLPVRFTVGSVIGAFLGWFICHRILSGDIGEETPINVRVVSSYPSWIIILFPISLGAVVVGFISMLYMWLFGFSIIALAGSYLVALGMVGLYYVLGAAERYASR